MSGWWQTWDYNRFAYNAYNEIDNPWPGLCLTKNSPYVNPNTKLDYFRKGCIDPYTGYNFWYRKFADQQYYLNCYWLPTAEPNYFKTNTWGYIGSSKGKCKSLGRQNAFNRSDGGFHYYE